MSSAKLTQLILSLRQIPIFHCEPGLSAQTSNQFGKQRKRYFVDENVLIEANHSRYSILVINKDHLPITSPCSRIISPISLNIRLISSISDCTNVNETYN